MIRIINNCFALCTKHSAYAFRVNETGHPEHLHYGASLGWTADTPDGVIENDCGAMAEKRSFELGNTVVYSPEHKTVMLEDLMLEAASIGKGDLRDPFAVVRYADGSTTSDFVFEKAELLNGAKAPLEGLPSSHAAEGEAEQLLVTLKDAASGVVLELTYTVYEAFDVICRSSRIVNGSGSDIDVLRLMSAQVDFSEDGFELTSFHGAWTREMEKETVPVKHALVVNSSVCGASSNRSNPFVMLHRPQTCESFGEVWGFNLIYSGNHYESAGVNAYGKTRFLNGINPQGFSFRLAPGEAFQAPEAVMCWSDRGFSGMSQCLHGFVRKHITPDEWQGLSRPVLLNSWEASYFDISESKLLRLARAAQGVGIELFVVDDGWFGRRDNDTSSLGDWFVNKKKFPSGLKAFGEKLKAMGLQFGIWIEPEMISVDSELYRAHPHWSMEIPGRAHSEGRNQRILDMANPEVPEYIGSTLAALLKDAGVNYVKWDMNRVFSDVFSQHLPAERQGETAHRYMLGVYRLFDILTKALPGVLFEGCASGGNRFDLGILCYCPQIWGSDNTDALCRAHIQEGYSYGYPMNCVSAHVSSVPNHQTLRETPLATRFNVACFGSFGYELNLADLPQAELAKIKAQVELYKKWRDVLQNGDFYRLECGSTHKWICVSKDKRRAVGMLMRELAEANTQYEDFKAAGLDPDLTYRFYSVAEKQDIRQFGDLVNTVSPVHIKQNSLAHNLIARFVKLDGEAECAELSGSALMGSGIRLLPSYGGTGFNDRTRCFPDFSSRLFFIEAI